MSTLVARPVAVDIKSILKTEGSSPSPTSSRSQTGLTTTHGRISQAPRAPSPAGPSGPPVYPVYPPPVRAGPPPLQPAPGYGAPPPPPENPSGPAYYPHGFHSGPPTHGPYGEPPPHTIPLKRPPSRESHPFEPAPKKQSKWTEEEDDQLITLRGEGMKWEEIAKHVPGRSAIACRLHYQNFLERRAAWDEEKKNKLAQLYNRLKGEIWEKISRELHMPWRAVEEMHWRMGRTELAQRAGVREFLATPDPTGAFSTTGVPITTSFIPSGSYPPGQPPYVSSPQALGPPLPPPQQGYNSPLPPPPSHLPPGPPPPPPQQSLPPVSDPNRPPPPPPYVSRPHFPSHRSHRSASSHASPHFIPSHRPQRSGSDQGSPRRRALDGSRLTSASMPPIPFDPRRAPSPPPMGPSSTLPPISRELSAPPSDAAPGPTLPPVRLLQEEVRENSRYTTPTHSGPSVSGSGPSRSHSTASTSRMGTEVFKSDGAASSGPANGR
ncbi:MAG: hypothetical protein Q9162_001532 [Coniocarpon cinnabarinum]